MSEVTVTPQKLYLVHCGFYDADVLDGNYESHVNFFVAAGSFDEARTQAKALPDFRRKRMHVDGMQEIQAVSGFEVALTANPALGGETVIVSNKHRELAPAKVGLLGNDGRRAVVAARVTRTGARADSIQTAVML